MVFFIKNKNKVIGYLIDHQQMVYVYKSMIKTLYIQSLRIYIKMYIWMYSCCIMEECMGSSLVNLIIKDKN